MPPAETAPPGVGEPGVGGALKIGELVGPVALVDVFEADATAAATALDVLVAVEARGDDVSETPTYRLIAQGTQSAVSPEEPIPAAG